MLGLQSHYLDFEILPTNNPKTIVFVDGSQYYEQPESPILQVVLPGHSKYFIVNIEARRVNIFNSNTLGYSDIVESECPLDFIDGIYKFTYKICPYEYLNITKYVLRTQIIDLALARIYGEINLGDCNDSSYKKELLEIHLLLESAKANTQNEFIDKANKDFSLAQKKVSKLVDNIFK